MAKTRRYARSDGVVTATTYGPYGQVDTRTVGGVLVEDNAFDSTSGQVVARLEGQTYVFDADGRLSSAVR